MKLDIRAVAEDAPLSFQCSMDLSALRFTGRAIYLSPIRIEGRIVKATDVLTLDADWHTELSLCCDRCAAEFTREASGRLTVTLSYEAPQEERDDIYVLQDGFCDTDELFRPVFILLPEQKILCREDCAGLEHPYVCDRRDPDPRWDALRDYYSE